MYQSFLAYSVVDIGLNPQNIRTGNTFDVSLSDSYDFIVSDNDTGVTGGADAEGDQILFVQDSVGNVVVDGETFYLETVITFTIDGVSYTGYYFESDDTGADFMVFSEPIPAGTATVSSINTNPTSVDYAQLYSSGETIDEGGFEFLGLTGDDTLSGDGGDDNIFANWGNDLVYGGAGNDAISGEGGADTLWGEAGDDQIYGGLSEDVVDGGTGNDTIDGGSGNDILTGGDGDDTIYGGTDAAATFDRLGVEWNHFSDPDNDGVIDNGDDLNGQTVSVGSIDVSVTTSSPGITNYASTTLLTTGVDGGTSTVSPNSAMGIEGDGTTQITFSEGVENLQFRISDFESGPNVPLEIITINAYDIDGNLIQYTVDLGAWIQGDDTDGVAGADTFYTNQLDLVAFDTTPEGSMLVTIPGPVAMVEFVFNSQGGSLVVSDLYFDNPETEFSEVGGDDIISGGAGNDILDGLDGNDTISGGTGNDTISGGTGNDIITFADGDSVSGGDGDDLFILEDLGEASNGTITINGGGATETSGQGDTLQLGDLADLSTLNIQSTTQNSSGNTTYSGTVTLDDGTVLNFSEIENIVCFVTGTQIDTPIGPRPIETLKVGDLVNTLDHGPQPIRWIQSSTVSGKGNLAPVCFEAGTLPGQDRELRVSPQHRVLFGGYLAELHFGEDEVLVPATCFVGSPGVTQDDTAVVTYVHMLFDQHEIVTSEGCHTESFHPGEMALTALDSAARNELFAIFPDLRHCPSSYGSTARRVLRSYEACVMLGPAFEKKVAGPVSLACCQKAGRQMGGRLIFSGVCSVP
ncbi:hypothetical protein EU803_15530 [Loktanella sp. IMCC34160]|uniref:Hint domain-containing protein n=1 Tax=Loktanella sp. IMCC34160 TaxID=2510646 RepID=UPI00101C5F5C|nr:Hint domain-containing protein [Loktanella sp. IMCC34160]RYG90025.1 hypothetical protein EU803_15530 [Loktanella sp. IMCC34160]